MTTYEQNPKIRIIVRRDLSPGDQATQASHAAFQYSQEFPVPCADWFKKSNYIALLSVKDEQSLDMLRAVLERNGCAVSAVREPDLGNALTALAIGPSAEARRLTARLPLAFKEDLATVS